MSNFTIRLVGGNSENFNVKQENYRIMVLLFVTTSNEIIVDELTTRENGLSIVSLHYVNTHETISSHDYLPFINIHKRFPA